MYPPRRIVCLTEETTETIYLLGEEHRIVGISGYTVRPACARKEKPRVSAFIRADIQKILDLKPDLALTFSDLQAEIASELIHNGICVHAFNQRTISEILDMILTVGALLGATGKAQSLVDRLKANIDATRERTSHHAAKPAVYFEEWDDPMISAIAWVSELIAIAGGRDIFGEVAHQRLARGRIVTADAVIERNPDIVIGSWCGRRFDPSKFSARRGFHSLAAVQNSRLYEVKSAIILQPGPAALTDGLAALEHIIIGQ